MKKRSMSKALFALLLAFMLILSACSKDDAKPATTEPKKEQGTEEKGTDAKEDGLFSIDDFSNIKTNEGTAIDGGILKYGLVSDTPFEGTLNYVFYSGNPDAMVIQFFNDSLLDWDANYVYTQDGAATYKEDPEVSPAVLATLPEDVAKEVAEKGVTFTFTIRDNVNWHDGQPVTAEDWLFAHEIIANKDYDGPRYGSDFTQIVGMDEFHEGTAKTISGIEVVDQKTMKITFKEATPSLLTGSIWTHPLAKHIFKDIPVADMSKSPAVRQNPIGFGAFKVDTITPGESVTYVRNDDYWRGAPKLDGVELKVINDSVIVQALEKGEVDMVDKFNVDLYPDNANMPNVEFLGIVDRAYTYIGFKLGTWDKEAKKVKLDPTKKMADVELRKAMWHAVDNNAVGDKFYHGLRWNATTLIPPSHPEFHDSENKGRAYDPELAKKILDDAGYKDVDGDGIRENKDGEPLVINFASMSGGDTAEPLAKYYIQAWQAIGLKVELLDGRLQEFNTFYERVGDKGDDDPEVDIFQGAWQVGIDVDPRGLYGPDAIYNFSRWENAENDRLLAAAVSQDAFDVTKRQELYKEWQQLMVEEIPVFPTLYRSKLVPVNKRVLNYAIGDGTGLNWNDVQVTQEAPFKK
ncbi:oligopeptide ABC transporter substrate-binding protein [Bacillus sp. Bva_UNVM-123]|uniref:oligopeptide ABC transporter substrate-binding protein n=1 Tax=Bacillus sp. Bva_UNVM-123 TaxID=2829798 RepID=UPI00391F290E